MTSPRDFVAGRLALSVAGAFALVWACQTAPATSSETHFLTWCPDDAACGSGLHCSCGVCAAPCVDDQDCRPHSERARCVGADERVSRACSEPPAAAACDVICTTDVDCAPLGPSHRCESGACRRLAADCALGATRGDDVVILGDGFLASSAELGAELMRLARAAGALGEGEQYRDHSSMLIGPFGEPEDLEAQYAVARDAGIPGVILMNAGGPDALLTCPDPPTSSCPALANATAGTEQLLARMATDNVRHVVVLFYPEPEDPTLAAKFDVLRPMLQAVCDSAPVPCHFLDLRATFTGNEADYLQPGGVLPTPAGATATAGVLWSLMRQQCVAQ